MATRTELNYFALEIFSQTAEQQENVLEDVVVKLYIPWIIPEHLSDTALNDYKNIASKDTLHTSGTDLRVAREHYNF